MIEYSPAEEVTRNTGLQRAYEFQAVLLGMAGHELRQQLQVILGAHERLGIGVRSESEQDLLRMGQHAINRLTRQLDQILGAFHLCEYSKNVELSPVALEPLFRLYSMRVT